MDRLLSRVTPARAADIAVGLLIVLFAWLGWSVHGSIAGLGEMAREIRDTGIDLQSSGKTTSDEIRRSVGGAADAVGGLPIVGGPASAAIRRTANVSADAVARESRLAGRHLAVAGTQGEEDARATARLVGWLAFLIPTVLLLAQVLPPKLRRRWPVAVSGGPPSG